MIFSNNLYVFFLCNYITIVSSGVVHDLLFCLLLFEILRYVLNFSIRVMVTTMIYKSNKKSAFEGRIKYIKRGIRSRVDLDCSRFELYRALLGFNCLIGLVYKLS